MTLSDLVDGKLRSVASLLGSIDEYWNDVKKYIKNKDITEFLSSYKETISSITSDVNTVVTSIGILDGDHHLSNTEADDIIIQMFKFTNRYNSFFVIVSNIITILGNTVLQDKESTDIVSQLNFSSASSSISSSMSSINTNFSDTSTDTSQLSYDERMTLADDWSKITIQYAKFRSQYVDVDESIITQLASYITTIVMEVNDVFEKFLFVRTIQKQNIHAIQLYCMFVQSLIEKLGEKNFEGRKTVFRIIERIEDDKDIYIDISESKEKEKLLTKHKTIHVDNPLYKRFMLSPTTTLMSLEDLMIKMYGSYKVLSTLSKKHNVCFIICNHIVTHPIEYRANQLFMETHIDTHIGGTHIDSHVDSHVGSGENKPSTFQSGGFPGINKTVLELTTTIKPLESLLDEKSYKAYKPSWQFDYEIIGDIEGESFCIIECLVKSQSSQSSDKLDDNLYRLLEPWIKYSGNPIPRFRIEQFIKHITGNNKYTRVHNYHQNMMKNSTQNMFIKKPMNMDYLANETKHLDISMIKNTIQINVMKHFTQTIKKIKNIQELLSDEKLSNIFMDTVILMYNKYSSEYTSKVQGDGEFPELLSTYIADLTRLTSRFNRELINSYNKEPLKPEALALMKSDAFQSTVLTKIESIVTHVLSMLITDKSNIYQSINYKYLLLSYE